MYWNPDSGTVRSSEYGLIETWDVLKWRQTNIRDYNRLINRNMRCIEIGFGIVKKWEVED